MDKHDAIIGGIVSGNETTECCERFMTLRRQPHLTGRDDGHPYRPNPKSLLHSSIQI